MQSITPNIFFQPMHSTACPLNIFVVKYKTLLLILMINSTIEIFIISFTVLLLKVQAISMLHSGHRSSSFSVLWENSVFWIFSLFSHLCYSNKHKISFHYISLILTVLEHLSNSVLAICISLQIACFFPP